MKYSVIVPISDFGIHNNNMKKTLQNQNYDDYELIEIDSHRFGYRSAAQAINSIIERLHGEYVIIVHQDVNLLGDSFFQQLDTYIDGFDFGVLGVAGKAFVDGKYEIVTKIIHTSEQIPAGTYSDFTVPIETESIDECLIIIKASTLREHPFIYFADTYHLYAHQYCLEMKKNDKKSYILPIQIWHNSKYGSLDVEYFKCLIRLCKMYRVNRTVITLYGVWPTNFLLLRMKCLYRVVKLKLLG